MAYLDPLDKETLRRILTEPKNSVIKQYKKLFKIDGIELEFDEEALQYIVDKAVEFKLGARGLRSVMEEAMLDVMYELPSDENATECVINEQVITNGEYPVILYENTENKKSA